MKKINNNLDLKKYIEIYTMKESVLETFKSDKSTYITCYAIYLLLNFIMKRKIDVARFLGSISGLILAIKTSPIIYERPMAKHWLEIIIEDLKKVGPNQNIELKNFKKSIIESEQEKETYYLCQDKKIKVNHKKVVSYIGLNKKDKLTIIKQITNEFKYHNKNMPDKEEREMFLLEIEDLKELDFINEDGTLNTNNNFVKKLMKKRIED